MQQLMLLSHPAVSSHPVKQCLEKAPASCCCGWCFALCIFCLKFCSFFLFVLWVWNLELHLSNDVSGFIWCIPWFFFQEHPEPSSEPGHAVRAAGAAAASSHSTAPHCSPLVPAPHPKPPALEKRGFHESFTKAKPRSYKIQAVAPRESTPKVTDRGPWEPRSKNGTQEQDPGLVDLDDASLPVSDV